MTHKEIEHMWKVASNNPNHDTNWHDPVIVAFAKLVGAHTLMNIDPSKFMSHQEGIEAGRLAERQWLVNSGLIGVLKHCEDLLREDGHEDAVDDVQNMIAKIKSRGQA
jgi:hypothetical protein